MKKRVVKSLIVFTVITGVLALSFPGIVKSAQPRPEWANALGGTQTPGIIEGIGFGVIDKKSKEWKKISRDTAYNDALQKMTVKLQTTVKGKIETKLSDEIEKVSGKKPKEITKESLDSTTQVVFDSVLGRKHFEEWTDDKKEYYVRVWMTVEEADRALEEAMKERQRVNTTKLKSSVDLTDLAETALSSGDISTSFDQYNAALKTVNEISGAVSLESGVSNLELKLKLENRFKEIITSIKTVGYGDNQSVQLNQGTEKPLTVKVYYTIKGTNIPAKNMPLTFTFTQGSGEIDTRVRTDEEGMARSKVINVTTEGLNVVTATFDLDELNKVHPSFVLLSGQKVKFSVDAKSQKMTKRIFVVVKETNSDIPRDESYVATEINRLLVEQNYKVVTAKQVGAAGTDVDPDDLKGKAEVLVSGKAKTEYIGDKITMPDGTEMKFNPSSRAMVNIEVIDITTGKAIGSATESGVKGFGRTKEESGDDALKKCAAKIGSAVIKQVEKAFAK